jgi:hypothetical protein
LHARSAIKIGINNNNFFIFSPAYATKIDLDWFLSLHLPEIQGHSKLGAMKTRPAFRGVSRVVTMTMAMPMEMSNRVWEAR